MVNYLYRLKLYLFGSLDTNVFYITVWVKLPLKDGIQGNFSSYLFTVSTNLTIHAYLSHILEHPLWVFLLDSSIALKFYGDKIFAFIAIF